MAGSYLYLSIACLLLSGSIVAQHCHLTLEGTIQDKEEHHDLAFATIFIKELGKGAVADEKGHYAFQDLCQDSVYTVIVSHIECEHITQIIRLNENSTVDFILTHKDGLLQEIVVREKAVDPKTAQAANTLNEDQLSSSQGINLGDAARQLPGVSLLSTGATITKPVIQGLHSNRIAIVANGVTIEGQQWGQEHAPEFDPFIAQNLSVIKGAAAIRYGPGAMGGALIIEPAPLRSKAGIGGWAALGVFSNGRAGFGSGALEWKAPESDLALRIQGTFKRSGNLHTPDYFLGNTGNLEYHFSAQAGWNRKKWQTELFYYNYNQRLGILRASHTGNLTDLYNAIQSPVPLNNEDAFTWDISRPFQSVNHHLMKLKSTLLLSDLWKMTTQYSFQYNVRKEFDAHKPYGNFDNSDKVPQISFYNFTNMLDNSFEHKPVFHWQGTAGAQVFWQYNQTGTGGYVPDHLTKGVSVYAWERWRRFPHPLELEVGLRYDLRHSHVTDTIGSLRKLDTLVNYGNLSGVVGLVWHFRPALSVIAHSGIAWRPPYVTELFAKGVHHGSATYENGNNSLRPEIAWNSNLSLEWKNDRVEATATIFRNRIRDFIYLNPDNQVVQTVRGAFPSYSYQQSDLVLSGIDASARIRLFKKWSLTGKYASLSGKRILQNGADTQYDWLPLMPGDMLQAGIRYDYQRVKMVEEEGITKKGHRITSFYFNPEWGYFARQYRIPSEGLLKAAPDAYWLVSFESGVKIAIGRKELQLGLTARNLTNNRYRDYLNFFRYYADEPGFNIGLRSKIIF